MKKMNHLETFKTLYEQVKAQPTPTDVFFEEVCKVAHCRKNTVKMWLYDVQRPSTSSLLALSEHFGIPAQQLFPPIENTKPQKRRK